jgi:hypothetical protein
MATGMDRDPNGPRPGSTATAMPTASSTANATATASASATASDAPKPERIAAAAAEGTLFLGTPGGSPAVHPCRQNADEDERIRCLLRARYEGDAEATAAALDLFATSASIPGLEPEQEMDGGFRGRIHLVPELPVGQYRKHLGWITATSHDFAGFFAGLAHAAKQAMRYRFRAIAFHFFRSVKRTTPSAYAQDWGIAYNVSGSLNTSESAVRETLFHEIFHVNDQDHGDWSPKALGAIFDAIVQKCGTRVACLSPYAPGDTQVRGGTYYAFQPDNGQAVHEYAAELAARYYRENRAVLRGESLGRAPFKCGPDENRRAWEAIVQEFFGGADRTGSCAR